ncbi:MAG: HD domain-containing protein [Deltaproteobacteria bacterium]|nr:HD domain-containing protein [Deltaproteobacteria bacterium]
MNKDELCEQFKKQPIIASILKRLHAELPKNLTYHSAQHAEEVLSEVIDLALHDSLSDREVQLLAVAAAYHDAGFIIQYFKNEIIGAQMAREAMQTSGEYSKEEIEQVVKMILDTELKPSETGAFKQFPTTELSKYLLDADVGNLGRDDFFEKGKLLLQELKEVTLTGFYKNSVALLKAHEWHTKAAKELREQKKQENLRLLQDMISEGI